MNFGNSFYHLNLNCIFFHHMYMECERKRKQNKKQVETMEYFKCCELKKGPPFHPSTCWFPFLFHQHCYNLTVPESVFKISKTICCVRVSRFSFYPFFLSKRNQRKIVIITAIIQYQINYNYKRWKTSFVRRKFTCFFCFWPCHVVSKFKYDDRLQSHSNIIHSLCEISSNS